MSVSVQTLISKLEAKQLDEAMHAEARLKSLCGEWHFFKTSALLHLPLDSLPSLCILLAVVQFALNNAVPTSQFTPP